MGSDERIEHDSMGELRVPGGALWGAQTQRAVQNFPISGLRMPREFIRALALVKAAAATANADLGHLPAGLADRIVRAALAVADGAHDRHFPVDVFQTGSGTSSNMNANEVIAALANGAGSADGATSSAASDDRGRQVATVHPNDHVNLGQSSNDVIPTAIQVAAASTIQGRLLPALRHLKGTIERRANEFADVVKTGRTHLMDAMPLTLGQEFGCWAAQLRSAEARIEDTLRRTVRLPLGGTAIGTGINADPAFAARAVEALARSTQVDFRSADNLFEGIASQDVAVELSGQLNALAVALMKISNDLRWMNSGPLAGLGEIELPALQPGSSIMPGKVNPVIPEALCMVCAQVMGQHTTITIAGQSGNFQLNVMLPVIAHNLLQSIELLAAGMTQLTDAAIAGLRVRQGQLREALERNPILVTALNPVIGYEAAARIAKRAYAEGRAVRDVAAEMSGLSIAELDRLLDPALLAQGGIHGASGSGG